MGLSVELFRKNKQEDKWQYACCLYNSMISPSRELITQKMNTICNEEIPERFVWGHCDIYHGSWHEEPVLVETANIAGPTMIMFSTLKKVWKDALGETIEIENNDVRDDDLVGLATGR